MLDKYPMLKSRINRALSVMQSKGFTSREQIADTFDYDANWAEIEGLEDVLAPMMEMLMLLPPDLWAAVVPDMPYYKEAHPETHGDSEGQTRPSFDPE